MKALFVAAPRADDDIAAWELANHCAASGHDVCWFGVGPGIESGDTALRRVAPPFPVSGAPWGDAPDHDAIVATTLALTGPFRDLAEEIRPDLIVSDSEAVWGTLVAEALEIACVTYSAGLFRGTAERRAFLSELSSEAAPQSWGRSPPALEIAIEGERQINRLRNQLGLAAGVSLDKAVGQFHLLFSSREVEFDGVGFSENVRCVGPICEAAPPLAKGPGQARSRTILVPEPALWQQASALFGDTGYAPSEPGDQSIDGVVAVYCSGNFATVQTALARGLPLLLAPRSPVEWLTARRIEALGLGRLLEGRSPADLLEAFVGDAKIGDALANMRLQHRLMPPRDRALRLLEQVASGDTATLAGTVSLERRLPHRPRFARCVGLVANPEGGVTVGSYHKTYRIRAGQTAETLGLLWRALDGRQTLDELLDAHDDLDTFVPLLEWLAEHELLEDATGAPLPETEDEGRYDGQIALFAHASGRAAPHPQTGGPRLQAQLAKARVGIVGAGVLGTNLARGLALAGIGMLHLADRGEVSRKLVEQGAWFDSDEIGQLSVDTLATRLTRLRPDIALGQSEESDIPFADLDFLIVTAERGLRPDFDRIGSSCDAARVPWTSLRQVRWNIEIGPTVIPRMSACFSCFEARREGALASDPERRDVLSDLDAGGFQWAIGPELASVETVKFLTGFGDPTSVGHVLVLNPLQLALSHHPVLRLPNCPRCGRAAEWSNQAMWRTDAMKEGGDVANA